MNELDNLYDQKIFLKQKLAFYLQYKFKDECIYHDPIVNLYKYYVRL